jgi:hypothetical protein
LGNVNEELHEIILGSVSWQLRILALEVIAEGGQEL